MKTIKVCGRRARVLCITGICLAGGSVISGCATSKNIPYRHLIYKTTYNYLRAVECLNTEQQQNGYEPCVKSYAADFDSYRRMRDQFIDNIASTDQGS